MPHIDVHAHAFSPAYIDLLEELGAGRDVIWPARMVIDEASPQGLADRLGAMDASDVARQVLSMSAATPYFDDPAAAVRATRFINDEHAELCRSHAARFSFFATLPMPHVDVALTEIARAFDELGAAGITFTTHLRGRPLTEPAFEPVFAELDRRSAVVFLHPPGLACASPLIRDSGLAWSVGAPVEDAVCALQLMKAGFPRRFPNLKIILPHLGGFLPFLRYRLDRSADRQMPGEDPPSVQMTKFWYDSANGEPDALRAAVRAYGIGRVLYGSDYPYWTGASYTRTVEYLAMTGLGEEELEAIRHGNAQALFSAAGRPQSISMS
jgi:predicted TIM-barrel fold metal-dependent hydrolase